MRQWRQLRAIGLILLIVVALLSVSGLLHQWHTVSPFADTVDTFIGAVPFAAPILLVLWRQVRARRRTVNMPQTEWFAELAAAERERVQDDLLMRGVTRATIDVRWNFADDLGASTPGTRRPVQRRLDDLLDLGLNPFRLVVAGPAGSGKSIALGLLAARLHANWVSGQPLPVVLAVSGWTQTESIERWAARELALRHPQIAGSEAGTDRTTELLRALRPGGAVVLFLDGFDELAPLRRVLFIRRLNQADASMLAVVLSTREPQFASATAEAGPLRRAGVIRLMPTEPVDFLQYLEDSAARHLDSWRALLDLTHSGQAPAITGAFDTPLMQWLGLQMYDHTSTLPAELADTERFATADAIKKHLLAYLLPSVLQAIDDAPNTHGGWPQKRAQHWLGFLARHTQHSPDGMIRWWRLYRSCRIGMCLAYGVLAICALTTVTAVSAEAGAGLAAGAVWGVGCGSSFSLAYSWLRKVQDTDYAMSGLFRLSTERYSEVRRLTQIVPFLVIPAIIAQVAVGLQFARLDQRILAGVLIRGLLFTAATGLLGGLIAAILLYRANGLDSQVAPANAVRPGDLLRRDGAASAAVAVCYAAATTLAAWGAWPHMPGQRPPLLFWLLAVITAATTGPPMFTSWPVFRAAHLWLASCDRLPIRYEAFMQDLCQVGLMRMDGTAYLFRHELLRTTLTGPVDELVVRVVSTRA